MNILSKIGKAMDAGNQIEVESRSAEILFGQLRSIDNRNLTNFRTYEMRRVRSILNQ